jgi:hypothetical protein
MAKQQATYILQKVGKVERQRDKKTKKRQKDKKDKKDKKIQKDKKIELQKDRNTCGFMSITVKGAATE